MESVILSLAYILPLAALLWLWVGFRLPVLVKLLLTLLLPVAYVLHWQGLQANKGWPTDEGLPERFQLLAADVVEPRQGQREGAIYLWIKQEQEQPRVHALPYTRKLHEALHTTRQRMQQGRTQVGLLLEEGDSGGSGASVGSGRVLEFRDRANAGLPPKRSQ